MNQRYTTDFIEDAVRLYRDNGEPFGAIAARLGIPDSTLRGWYDKSVGRKKGWTKQLEQGLEVRTDETAEQKLARLERENRQLRKQVDELETDKAILKKSIEGSTCQRNTFSSVAAGV